MIAVTIVFGLVAWFEWRYLRSRRRRARTVRIVFGYLLALWLLTFAVALFGGRQSLGIAFAELFAPLQRLIFIE